MSQDTLENLLGSIPAEHYFQSEILPVEIECIFEPSWLCVGFTDELTNHNDFITAQIGHRNIVVQNFHGTLRAFRNVCSHRFSRIQTKRCGNRPLQCPYHGWSYNVDGIPTGIPRNNDSFYLDQVTRNSLALETYETDCVGKFVFVRMSGHGPTLLEYLKGAHEDLLAVSELDFERIEQLSLDVACNWKIGMENGVEGYHLPLIYSSSFANVIGTDLETREFGRHCTHEGPLKVGSKKWWELSVKTSRLNRVPNREDYVSFMIFPNIVTTFTHGAFFTFQTLWPESAETMRIESSGWLARGDGPSRKLLVQMLKDFSGQVRNKDKEICQTVQQGLRERAQDLYLLGGLENRIHHFQTQYASLMKGTSNA